MDMTAIRAAYDAEQRRDPLFPASRVEHTAHTTRLISTTDARATITYAGLDADNADDVIAAELAAFRAMPAITRLEWKLYDYDLPPDLQTRLAAHGFSIGEAEAICVLDLADLPDRLRQPPTHDVRRLTHLDQVAEVLAMKQAVWPEEEWVADGWLGQMLTESVTAPDPMLHVYIAYVDGVAISSGWIDLPPGRQFAGLWGGSTMPGFRGRGLYTALIAARAADAIAHGVRYLTIDASPMSRPIVERLGFQHMAWSWPCEIVLHEE